MSAKKRETVYLHGTLNWAKVIGAPRPNYDGDAREWTFELVLDEESIKALKDNGVGDRIKGKGYNIGTKGQHKDREPFIQLRRKEFDYAGEANDPIRIVDAANQHWDDRLIGNDSEADVKVQIVDYGKGKKAGVYPAAIRVLNLVEYEGGDDFEALPDDDERVQAARKGRNVDRADDFEKDFGIENENASEEADQPDPNADLDDDMPAE